MTSESEPIHEDNPTPNTKRESDIQAQHGNTDIPTALDGSSFPPAKTHCQIACETEKDWWDKFKRWVEIAGFILLAIYTDYTIKMYQANKQAADAATSAAQTAERTMLLDERAWVSVPSVNGTRPEAGQKQLKFIVHFTDTGRSPALNLIVYPGEEVLDKGVAPTFTKDIGLVRLGVLSPGSERTYENFVSIANIDVFKTQTLSVHGKITYDDIFGCHHWVTYAAYLRNDWSGFSFYPEYNDTDNDYQPCKSK